MVYLSRRGARRLMGPRHFARVTPRRLAREFKGGLSMVGLARKYGLTRREVEDWI